MPIVSRARDGHGGHQPFESSDGARYEVQTEETWWGIRAEHMPTERFLALLGSLMSRHVRVPITIDGVEHTLSLVKISGLQSEFDDKEQEHRFKVYIHVTRRSEVDRDQRVAFCEAGRVELSLALGFELPLAHRKEG